MNTDEIVARIIKLAGASETIPQASIEELALFPFPEDFLALVRSGYVPQEISLNSVKAVPVARILKENLTYYRVASDAGYVVLTTDFGGDAIAWDTKENALVRLDHNEVPQIEDLEDMAAEYDVEVFDFRRDSPPKKVSGVRTFVEFLERELEGLDALEVAIAAVESDVVTFPFGSELILRNPPKFRSPGNAYPSKEPHVWRVDLNPKNDRAEQKTFRVDMIARTCANVSPGERTHWALL